MYKYNTPQELFTAICDKIRDKTNSNELINHQDIPDKIDELISIKYIKEFVDSAIQGEDTAYYTFNNTVTTVQSTIFAGTNLVYIDMSKCTSIGNNAFEGCTGLTTVNLPECTSIGGFAFRNCTSLTTVNLPKYTSIGYTAFENCTNLTTIILSNNQVVTLEHTRTFNNSSIANGTGYIYVPDNLVDSYKTATNWSTYASQIKPISELPSNLKEEYGYE